MHAATQVDTTNLKNYVRQGISVHLRRNIAPLVLRRSISSNYNRQRELILVNKHQNDSSRFKNFRARNHKIELGFRKKN
jgi:hypothetical protein